MTIEHIAYRTWLAQARHVDREKVELVLPLVRIRAQDVCLAHWQKLASCKAQVVTTPITMESYICGVPGKPSRKLQVKTQRTSTQRKDQPEHSEQPREPEQEQPGQPATQQDGAVPLQDMTFQEMIERVIDGEDEIADVNLDVVDGIEIPEGIDDDEFGADQSKDHGLLPAKDVQQSEAIKEIEKRVTQSAVACGTVPHDRITENADAVVTAYKCETGKQK